jgi:hypothetical protein
MIQLAYVIQLLNGFLALVPTGTALYNQLVADKSKFQQWAASNYVPTDADWQTVHDAIKPFSDAIDLRATQE